MQLGDLPKAIASLRQRIKQKPNDATLHYLIGEALIRSGAAPGNAAFVAARAAWERSIKLNAKFAPSHIDLAKIYLRENRLDEGLQHLEIARSLDPQDKSAYSQLAIAYWKKGKPEMVSVMLAALNKLNDQERAEEAHRKRLEAVGDASSPEATPVPTQRDSSAAQQQHFLSCGDKLIFA